MIKLRSAKINGIDCRGIAKEISAQTESSWIARVEIEKEKFQEKEEYWYEGYAKTDSGLKVIEGVMFGRWPIDHGNIITVDLQTTIMPTIKDVS